MAETAPEACYSGVALLRKIAGIVPYTPAAIDVKTILIRRFNDQKKCQELILINYWRPAPISVT